MFATLKVGAASLALVGTTLAGTAMAQETPPDNPGAAQDQGRFQGPLMDTILTFLDISKGDVISNWATGDALADLAEANGSTGEALAEALMDVVNARIDEAVANGNVDQERAAELKAKAEERINHLVFEAHGGPGGGPGLGGEIRQGLMDVIEEELGLNQGQIVSHVRTEGTLAELAEENGSSGEELVDALYAYVEAKVQTAIDEGNISEERGVEILENAVDRLNHMVFDAHEPGRGGPS